MHKECEENVVKQKCGDLVQKKAEKSLLKPGRKLLMEGKLQYKCIEETDKGETDEINSSSKIVLLFTDCLIVAASEGNKEEETEEFSVLDKVSWYNSTKKSFAQLSFDWDNFSFSLSNCKKNQVVYFFQCKDKGEVEDWVEAISACIRESKSKIHHTSSKIEDFLVKQLNQVPSSF